MNTWKPKDQVFALRGAFYCIVDGRTYGPWPMIEYARAGLATEQRRAEARHEKAYEERIAHENAMSKEWWD